MSTHRNAIKRSAQRLRKFKRKAEHLARQQRQRAGAPPHATTHRRRGIALHFARLRRAGSSAFIAFLSVLGPGLLAGLSDDDPAGITTYSVLGAEHGYRLLWIIPLSTLLLIHFHLIAVRIGAATGKGFVAAIRARWGHGWATPRSSRCCSRTSAPSARSTRALPPPAR
jgi:hypothetical protein